MNIEESNQYINHKNTSSFINNYIYEIPRKKNDVQDNNKQNKKVINVNYSKTFENKLKILLLLNINIMILKKLELILSLKVSFVNVILLKKYLYLKN